MDERLFGVSAASVTPCTSRGELDLPAVDRLVEDYAQQGLSGAFFPSSTGESFCLTQAQRIQLVQRAARAGGGRLAIYANASESCIQAAVAYTRAFADAGADYAVVMPPTFFSYTQQEIGDFLLDIADKSPLPIVVYNHMTRLPNPVRLPLLHRLAGHGNIVGIKDTHNDAARLMEIYEQGLHKKLVVQCGGDGMAGYSALLDMHMLNALCAVRPRLFLNLQRAGREKDIDKVAALQGQVNRLMGLFTALKGGQASTALFAQSIKAALSLRGLCGTHTVQLGYTLDDQDMLAVRKVLEDVQDDL